MEEDSGPLPLPMPLPPLVAAGPRRERRPWHVRLRERLPSYLPVLLMGAIALVTGWLVRQTPSFDAPATVALPSTEPDYEMLGFSVQHYDRAGPAQAVIEGDRVRHFPSDDTLAIDGARVRWTEPDGRQLRASALRAIAAGDGSEVRLEGQARVERDPGPGESAPLEFSSERLVFDTRAGRVRSDRPVRLRQGRSEFVAQGLDYDHPGRDLTLTGQVQGRIWPEATLR